MDNLQFEPQILGRFPSVPSLSNFRRPSAAERYTFLQDKTRGVNRNLHRNSSVLDRFRSFWIILDVHFRWDTGTLLGFLLHLFGSPSCEYFSMAAGTLVIATSKWISLIWAVCGESFGWFCACFWGPENLLSFIWWSMAVPQVRVWNLPSGWCQDHFIVWFRKNGPLSCWRRTPHVGAGSCYLVLKVACMWSFRKLIWGGCPS